ncbi:FecR family protein [Aestuariibaculum suncheonense]|uniref:FecR family protein n=1 Tax=Aestuariibaculum suncheonense TaxID=1028745 RepID=A0A8J6QB94_9FLAO|nr:FecR family protein [Aestuariibaculum suncheonense]MBD0834513.1 FecR family protein [Aestuariibaculum suncheonense]
MNEKLYSKYRVAELIGKSLMGTIESDEQAELDRWLQNDEASKLYQDIIDNKKLNDKYEFYQSLSTDKKYNQLQGKINKSIKVKRFRQLMKYAAILVLFLSVAFYWQYRSNEQEQLITQETLNEIKPGYSKATLILADGTEVALDAHKNQNIQSSGVSFIENKDDVLEYKAANDNTLANIGYNTLHVPHGGIYSVVLPDGTRVWVNSASSIKYPEAFVGETREVELNGEAYFHVVKSNKKFIVKTKTLDVTVLGTSFNVSAYDDDDFFATTLVEGKVQLTSEHLGEVILAPNQQGYYKKGLKDIQLNSKINVRNFTSWKDGKFYFEHEPLDNILRKLGRWYDFEVKFEDEKFKNIVFTGVARKDNELRSLMDMIAKTARIDYKAYKNENNTIEIEIFKN